MANWCGTSRTNYVHYTDRAALEESLEGFRLDAQFDERAGTVVFFGCDENDGGWPQFNDEDASDFWWEKHVMPFIREGDVLVTMQSGAEKLRYVTGYAEAFIRRGGKVEFVGVSLDDIYKKAQGAFGIQEIALAEY